MIRRYKTHSQGIGVFVGVTRPTMHQARTMYRLRLHDGSVKPFHPKHLKLIED